jgi:hypothetical protein
MPIIVLPDNHAQFEKLEKGCIQSDGYTFYIPESMWSKIKADLDKLKEIK